MPLFRVENEFYKGGRGENILRYIVGNKGGLGGGYCTIMCNNDNAPFPCREQIFFQTPRPIRSARPLRKQKKLQTLQKYLKTWRGGAITGNIVQYIAQ